ncbi:hypothetical protein CCP3SC1_640018 [Gammaproteobacteria bacterium]
MANSEWVVYFGHKVQDSPILSLNQDAVFSSLAPRQTFLESMGFQAFHWDSIPSLNKGEGLNSSGEDNAKLGLERIPTFRSA